MRQLHDDRGAALILSILFTLIINGLALTLFATTSREMVSSNSQVIYNDSFNTAEAAVNIGLLRVKAIMEANDPIDPSYPFSLPPFNLASEGFSGDDTLSIDEYEFYDLVNQAPMDPGQLSTLRATYVDTTTQSFTGAIDGFFVPETSNPVLFDSYLSGAEPIYGALLDVGESALLRGWRIYLQNDNDGSDKTAKMVAVGYMLDPQNDMLYQKRIEVGVIIHGLDKGKKHDPSGQVTSSETGAKTGGFRVSTDLEEPINSFDLR